MPDRSSRAPSPSSLQVPPRVPWRGELPRLERDHARRRIDMFAKNLFRMRGGHFFDVHTARGACDDDRLAGGAIDQHAEIQLAIDLDSFFDEHAANLAALRAGLMGHERHADHLPGDALRFVGRFRKLDAAALAAAACVNLRLDHDHAAAQPLSDGGRFSGIDDYFAARDGNTEPGENGFGLVLVNLQTVRDSCAWETHPCYWQLRESVNAVRQFCGRIHAHFLSLRQWRV